jgi:hypothetical protein
MAIAQSISALSYKCPYCGAPVSIECRTKSGRRMRGDIPVHSARLGLLSQQEIDDSKVKLFRFNELPLFRGLRKGSWP